MGYRSITVALILGFVAVPLSCGGDDGDDDTAAGKGGSAGKSGSTGAGKGGTAGKAGGSAGKAGSSAGRGGSSAGRGGTAGTAGSTAGTGGSTAGTGGTGTAGGGADSGGAGAGGESAGMTGTAGGGAGGEGGAQQTPEEARMVKCTSICSGLADEDGAGVGNDPAVCPGDPAVCAEQICDTTGFDQGCVDNLDGLLDCLLTVPADHFYCGSTDDLLKIDVAGGYDCPDTFYPWNTCRGQ